jgi:flavodoxin
VEERMNALIVYTSIHHKNTKKVAEEIAKELKADLQRAREVNPSSFNEYDLIGTVFIRKG